MHYPKTKSKELGIEIQPKMNFKACEIVHFFKCVHDIKLKAAPDQFEEHNLERRSYEGPTMADNVFTFDDKL